MKLRDFLQEVPDFPKAGILFYDIAPLLCHAAAWQEAMAQLAERVAGFRPQLLLGIESRGFLVAAPLALKLGCGFAMVRKPGKLPGAVMRHDYALEYGQDSLEIQLNSIKTGQQVIILDDVLATGGTLSATIALAQSCGAEVLGAACILELTALKGRAKVGLPVESLIQV